jgi:hypothetical protein
MEEVDHDLFQGTILASASKYWSKPRKSSVMTVRVSVEVRTGNLPDKSQMRYRLIHLAWCYRDSIAEVGRDDIFKPTIRNESLHEVVIVMGLE